MPRRRSNGRFRRSRTLVTTVVRRVRARTVRRRRRASRRSALSFTLPVVSLVGMLAVFNQLVPHALSHFTDAVQQLIKGEFSNARGNFAAIADDFGKAATSATSDPWKYGAGAVGAVGLAGGTVWLARKIGLPSIGFRGIRAAAR